jgi:GntR family transcriptional regulator/MocR family aminotransferase
VLADPARIVVCAGFSQGIGVLGRALQEVGIPEMAFEDPSFDRFRTFAAASGQRVVGVPVDQDGLIVDQLASPSITVTAAHQAPMGVTLAPTRRTALAKSGAVVIEDDYDGEFRFDRHQVGALQALAPERVVYAGTASKSLAPSLRLAWLVLPRFLVDPVIAAMDLSGAHPPVLEQLVLADMISTRAYDRHVRRCRTEYRSRRDRLVAALPGELTPPGISAGLHLMLPLPAAAEEAVPAIAARHSLAITTVRPYRMTEADTPSGLIVGYGAPARNSFTGALNALLGVLSEL